MERIKPENMRQILLAICETLMAREEELCKLDSYVGDGDVRVTAPPIVFETLGRCIGLKDRNGTLIFEGDIVGYKDIVFVVYFGEYGTIFVESNDYGYYLKNNNVYSLPYGLNPQNAKKLEIIGNIHDNPELLEVL